MSGTDITGALRGFLKRGPRRRRLFMAVVGVVTCALSVGFFKEAAFGTDPFQCLRTGIDLAVPSIGFGTLYVIICAVLLAAMLILDRRYLGVATLINLFLTGYIAQFSQWAIRALFGDPTLAVRAVYLIVGVVVMCFASAMYFTADLGVSTYDFIALLISARQKKVPFRFVRIGTDLICVIIGFALGYKPGIGTIITAFFMGPLISLFNDRCAVPFLRAADKKQPPAQSSGFAETK